ncbi:MAG: aminoacyl-histidine dipeptidase [Flavobacteriales bacterium]|nr:aminoacyl-histidine dipeptidase [Flavobacteriales bacterium]
MNKNVRNLEPQSLWNHFEDLNAVPRPSKNEARVTRFMKEFGESLGLDTYVDGIGNVIIRKPATPGMENRKTVILQSHIDMVHQKNSDTVFDFSTEGIRSYIDGDWVKAEGTTLGADNGIGVASIMALLSSTDIPHPAIEGLFTVDEETGMTGAFKLEQGRLNGSILLNLDTEDDDEFSIGCAGGIDTNTRIKFEESSTSGSGLQGFRLTVSGLKGGHSGVDIDLERGNANKIINRLMHKCSDHGLRISEIDGGSLRNAIPREASAVVCAKSDAYMDEVRKRAESICAELSIEDPGLKIEIEKTALPERALSESDTLRVTTCLQAVHNGVFTMSRAIEGLVETSSSLARVIVKNGEFITQSLQRSSIDSAKMDVAETVGAPFELLGCEVEHTGSYPGWAPNPHSPIKDILEHIYKERFGASPKVMAIHAGLECGIIGERYPGLDMISFGPTIKHPHSPDEKVSISSVQKFWGFLLEVLNHIPAA